MILQKMKNKTRAVMFRSLYADRKIVIGRRSTKRAAGKTPAG